MTRPHIICHMVSSIDGRLLPGRWALDEAVVLDHYDAAAENLHAEGWIVGRETMADYVTDTGVAAPRQEPGLRADRIRDRGGRSLAIAFDRSGRLDPVSGALEDEHLVLVLSERVSDTHVAMLAARGVSVVFAGPDGDDIAGALTRIGAAFGVTRLMLQGGGRLNAAFLAANVIDAFSTLVLPVIDAERGIPGIVDHPGPIVPRQLELVSVEALADGVVWMRHRVAGRAQ
ncbi:dihydrofolate reductase family protein [Frigidibacter sp. MR17.14]|uniref:dihydrofolate reductase family protein n=1 Tax=Frigidibacter sp. MR17.14 TaxID=3126509 RepID=UPI003012B742